MTILPTLVAHIPKIRRFQTAKTSRKHLLHLCQEAALLISPTPEGYYGLPVEWQERVLGHQMTLIAINCLLLCMRQAPPMPSQHSAGRADKLPTHPCFVRLSCQTVQCSWSVLHSRHQGSQRGWMGFVFVFSPILSAWINWRCPIQMHVNMCLWIEFI